MSALGHDIRGALTPILLAVDCLDADEAADVRAAVERVVTLAAQVDREGAVLEGLRLRCADLEARLAATERALASTGGDRSTSGGAGAVGAASALGLCEWDADVEWEPITTHRRPWPQAWQSLAPACPDGRYPVVSIRPRDGGPWLAMDVIGNLAAALNDATDGSEPDDEWEIRFGMAPIGWSSTLPEHGGW